MRRLPVLTMVIALLASPGAFADGEWQDISTKEGVHYEQREMSGSKYYEYRATLTMPVASAVAMRAIWDQAVVASDQQKRDYLRRTDDEIVVHDLVTNPIVSDREVTLVIKKTREPLGLTFEAHNELGPAPDGKRVQLPRVYGSWRIEPISAHESRLTYLCYSEPGGTIAAFLVRGPQAKQVTHDVARVRARIADTLAAKP